MKKKGKGIAMNIKENHFTCKRDDLTIQGMEYLPVDFDENKKYPVIIVSHGFTGNYTTMAVYCREFARMGYVAFCFSFCGGGRLGEEETTKSEGNTTDMTITTEVADLCAIIELAKSKTYADAENIILLGESQGGFVSGLTAAKCGDAIKKLIMIYPALCIPDHARRGCLGGGNYNPQNVPKTIDCGASVLGKAFHEEVVDMDPYLELAAYKGPVLILQGLNDTIVNYSYAIKAKESYREGQCHLMLVRDLGHGFNEMQQESALAAIRQFLQEKEEILTIRVIITGQEYAKEGEVQKNTYFFTGYCETKYFQGTILSEGCDVQEYHPETGWKIRAEYTLVGLDCNGEKCSIHIINQRKGEDWKPVIKTDSAALKWLNGADLTAVLEGGSGGPTVRIFAHVER